MDRTDAKALREEINRNPGWQVEVRFDPIKQDYYVAGVRANDERQWLFNSRDEFYGWVGELARPQPTVRYRGVYWTHFWNRQRTTQTHLFASDPSAGYAERDPAEGKTLCGESIPYEYREVDWVGKTHTCRRCLKVLARLEREGVWKATPPAKCETVVETAE